MENLTNHFNLVKKEACIYIISGYTLRVNSSAVSKTLKLMLLGMKCGAGADVGILHKNWNQLKETFLQYINIPLSTHLSFWRGALGGFVDVQLTAGPSMCTSFYIIFSLYMGYTVEVALPFPKLLPVRLEPQNTHTEFDSLIMYTSHYFTSSIVLNYYIILEFVEETTGMCVSIMQGKKEKGRGIQYLQWTCCQIPIYWKTVHEH